MALPVTVVGSLTGIPGHQPPYKSSGGNYYVVTRFNGIRIFKAADPTISFTNQDTASQPLGVFNILSSCQHGDEIRIASYDGALYQYHVFDMSTDTWTLTDETIETPADLPTYGWISIDSRSDGDVIVAYAGDTDRVMGSNKERVDYARREGGTWTVGVALDAAGDIHYGNPNLIKAGLTDDMRIVWQTTSNTADPPTAWTDVEAITLDSANSLSTTVTNTADTGGALLGISNLVGYEDAGTARTAFNGALASTDIIAWRATDDGSGDIQAPSNATVTTDDVYVNGEAGVLSLAEDSGVLYCLFSGEGTAGVDRDIYYTTSTDDGATWSTPTEEIDAITCNYISCNIYQRGSDFVLAYVYDDGGVQKYNEKVLSAAPAELAGDATINATVTGQLTTQIPVAAAAIIVSTATGVLSSPAAELAANPAIVTVANGVLTAAIKFNGSALVQSLLTGFINSGIPLFASPSGEATADAVLSSNINFLSSVTANALATGNIDSSVLLSANPVSSVAADGQISSSIDLLGAAISQALASGTLAVPAELVADATIQTSVNAGLSTNINLLTAAIANTLMAAALDSGISLAADAAGNVLSTVDLTNKINLLAAAASQATATGSLDIAALLNADAGAEVTVGGALTSGIDLLGASIAQALATGAMDVAKLFSASASGLVTANADLASGINLLTDAIANTLASGGLNTGILFAANATSNTLSNADITTEITFDGNALIQVLSTAALSTDSSGLQAAASAESNVSGVIETQILVVGEPTMAVTMAGAMTTGIPVQAAAASATNVTGGLNTQIKFNAASLINTLIQGDLKTGDGFSVAVLISALADAEFTTSIRMRVDSLVQAVATGALTSNVIVCIEYPGDMILSNSEYIGDMILSNSEYIEMLICRED